MENLGAVVITELGFSRTGGESWAPVKTAVSVTPGASVCKSNK